MELPEAPALSGEDMPVPKDYMQAQQKNGKEMCATEAFRETWLWLKARGCENLVSTQLIEQYAMSVARWIQCEEAISEYGFLAKHPTTGNAIQSPYVAMAQNYMKQANQSWDQIFQMVKAIYATDYKRNPIRNDVMEQLLRGRKGI